MIPAAIYAARLVARTTVAAIAAGTFTVSARASTVTPPCLWPVVEDERTILMMGSDVDHRGLCILFLGDDLPGGKAAAPIPMCADAMNAATIIDTCEPEMLKVADADFLPVWSATAYEARYGDALFTGSESGGFKGAFKIGGKGFLIGSAGGRTDRVKYVSRHRDADRTANLTAVPTPAAGVLLLFAMACIAGVKRWRG
ncbi:MAG: hypothetical protein AAGF30_00535 [Pseudomonadota bacterium]